MSTQRQQVSISLKPSFAPSPRGLLQHQCACGNHTNAGGECAECGKKKHMGLQTKLKVNEPGDVYEREADRIAGQVMAAPSRSFPRAKRIILSSCWDFEVPSHGNEAIIMHS